MIFGETISSTITKRKASFTNIISYKIGSSKIVADSDIGTGTTDTKTIPTSSASFLPNATSGTMVIELNTYNGNTLVGTTTKNITIAIPSSWAPSIGSVTLTNVDAFNNQLVKTKSKITATANSVEPSLGATIASVSFTSQDLSTSISSSPYSATSSIFTNYGTFTVTAVVTDSRGLTATLESIQYTVIDYAPPTLSMSGHRCTSSGEPNDFAEYVQLYLSGTWANEVVGNTWSVYVYKKQVGSETDPALAWSLTNQNGNISVDSSIIPASVDYSFEFTAYVEDVVGGVSETLLLQISTGSVILDLWKDKLVAFRKTANQSLYTDLGGTGTEKIFYSEGIQFFNGALYVPATGDDGFLNGWVRVRSGADEATLYNQRFTSASSPVTLTGGMKYSNLTFMGRPGSSIDINASVTIPTANIGSSTINYLISDPLAYFAFSLTASGDDVIMTYVGETNSGSGRITRVYASS